MSLPLFQLNPSTAQFDQIEEAVWLELERATQELTHGWRLPILGTVFENRPIQRIVVLREVARASCRIDAYTDVRSPKVDQIRFNPSVSWLFYDTTSRVQLSLEGGATLHVDDATADEHWLRANVTNRLGYLGVVPPGSRSATPSVNLPAELQGRVPTMEETETGRANFAVISCEVTAMDLLFINRSGNIRVRLERSGRDWQGCWLEP
ncbi:pyridoxamine 5'-phosphate oxidase family protein [Planctomicrobium sp. SH668]|uniref:hypothetical protein n=1 Tax=Planctomicrobium sp. SH668 TaxID=3448126 RepID=UPI003F5B2B43